MAMGKKDLIPGGEPQITTPEGEGVIMSSPEDAAAVEVRGDVDRVASVSLRADGTPDQSPGFVLLAEGDAQGEG